MKKRVLKDYTGQSGEDSPQGLFRLQARTSTGQDKARLGTVSLEKGLYLPAEWVQTRASGQLC